MSEPSQSAAVRRPTTRSPRSGPLPDVIPHDSGPTNCGVPRPVPDRPRHRLTRGEPRGCHPRPVNAYFVGVPELASFFVKDRDTALIRFQAIPGATREGKI